MILQSALVWANISGFISLSSFLSLSLSLSLFPSRSFPLSLFSRFDISIRGGMIGLGWINDLRCTALWSDELIKLRIGYRVSRDVIGLERTIDLHCKTSRSDGMVFVMVSILLNSMWSHGIWFGPGMVASYFVMMWSGGARVEYSFESAMAIGMWYR